MTTINIGTEGLRALPVPDKETFRLLVDAFLNVGRHIVVGRLKGGQAAGAPGAAEPNRVNWGGGTAAAARTDTQLGAEFAEARVLGTSSLLASGTSGTSSDTYRVEGTMTNDQGAVSKAVTEAGLNDTAKAAGGVVPVGNQFIRSDFAVSNVDPGNSLILRWDLRLT